MTIKGFPLISIIIEVAQSLHIVSRWGWISWKQRGHRRMDG